MSQGVTVVISPLISLIEDQVTAFLQVCSLLKAFSLHLTLPFSLLYLPPVPYSSTSLPFTHPPSYLALPLQLPSGGIPSAYLTGNCNESQIKAVDKGIHDYDHHDLPYMLLLLL